MRRMCQFLAVALVILSAAAAQDDGQKPKLSKEPLTAEQIAIYRAVLEDYVKESDGALNLANRTQPLQRGGPFWDEACVKPMQLEPAPKSGPVVHMLDPAVGLSPKMVLVDPEQQLKKVRKNDPENAINKGGQASEEEIGDTVKQAFRTALFTFSEIVFDREHRHAVVMYSFHCGMLCGHGNTVILEKVDDKWKISGRCGGWIS